MFPGNERAPAKRRVPQQVRSRDRVQRILEVTADLVVAGGVESVSTRAIASAADVPVASLYQYFADKEEVLLALVERDVAEMDAQVAEDLGRLKVLSVRVMVETTMRAFVKVYRRRPAFVMIWMRGRTNPTIYDYCRSHNQKMARDLFEVARAAGMVMPGLRRALRRARRRGRRPAVPGRLRGLARRATPQVIDEGIALVTAYLETHASASGIAGVQLS